MIACLALLLLAAPPPSLRPAAAPAECRPLGDEELRARVDSFLRALDVPVEPAAWRALGPRAVPLLERAAQEVGALPTRRAQALWGLVHLQGPAATSLAAALAAREGEPLVVRFAAVRGLEAVAPAGALEEALGTLLERAADARLRALSAQVLARRAKGAACARVRTRAAREEAGARPLFAAALEACR